MGCASSKAELIQNASHGSNHEFHSKYQEGKKLGEGQFGVVKLVHDKSAPEGTEALACKVLRKGFVFKDNALWPPLDPTMLQNECEIMRELAGKSYCLKLEGIYETPKEIYMVTELCSGGEMEKYVSKQSELRTEDVSRIAYQLLSAVDHCAKHRVIHRDIKGENVMFKSSQAGAELRLIDYGLSCMDRVETNDNGRHSTFAGSAFYISPEMFQKSYTNKTDVWSCGATLYVLVAGYPADDLQKAFNILQKSKKRNLRKLPNMPKDMPDSFFNLLNKLLVYRHKQRPSAGEILGEDEFVNFFQTIVQQEQQPEQSGGSRRMNRTQSIKIMGSVNQHAKSIGFKKYERSVTTLLATLLSKDEFVDLIDKIEKQSSNNQGVLEDDDEDEDSSPVLSMKMADQQLGVIKIAELKKILKGMKQKRAIELMDGLPNASNYETFAYHVALLKPFCPKPVSTSNGAEEKGKRRSSMIQRNQSVAADHFRSVRRNQSIRMSTTTAKGTSKSSIMKRNHQSVEFNMSESKKNSIGKEHPRKTAQRAKSMYVGKKSNSAAVEMY